MAPAGLATITMATSAATSASSSLLIELPSDHARRDGVAPAHEPRCPVPLPRAVAGVCAYQAGCVDPSQPGTNDHIGRWSSKAYEASTNRPPAPKARSGRIATCDDREW